VAAKSYVAHWAKNGAGQVLFRTVLMSLPHFQVKRTCAFSLAEDQEAFINVEEGFVRVVSIFPCWARDEETRRDDDKGSQRKAGGQPGFEPALFQTAKGRKGLLSADSQEREEKLRSCSLSALNPLRKRR
jgi:hypothetical protein